MRIHSLYYRDDDCNWTLQHTQFDLFTLFVGISGVGKSRILQAIMSLRGVVLGDTSKMGGVHFAVEFSTAKGRYLWKCKFQSLGQPNLKSRHARQLYPMLEQLGTPIRPKVLEESLTLDGQVIYQRDSQSCLFRGNPLPRLNPYRSLLELFPTEPELQDVRNSFLSVFLMEFTSDMNVLVDNAVAQNFAKRTSDEDERAIITSDAPVILRLAYYAVARPKKFRQIKEKFMDIFPHVEDVRFAPDYDGRYFVLQIREHGTDYIPQGNLSSGMFKSLMFLAQLSMLEGSCVVLIDEIENSLGLNCIDILAEELGCMDCDDQFFLTSHHPYIINSIDMRYWRVVSRRGSVVSVKTAEDLHLGDSSHEAFFQLINSSGYREGIES